MAGEPHPDWLASRFPDSRLGVPDPGIDNVPRRIDDFARGEADGSDAVGDAMIGRCAV